MGAQRSAFNTRTPNSTTHIVPPWHRTLTPVPQHDKRLDTQAQAPRRLGGLALGHADLVAGDLRASRTVWMDGGIDNASQSGRRRSTTDIQTPGRRQAILRLPSMHSWGVFASPRTRWVASNPDHDTTFYEGSVPPLAWVLRLQLTASHPGVRVTVLWRKRHPTHEAPGLQPKEREARPTEPAKPRNGVLDSEVLFSAGLDHNTTALMEGMFYAALCLITRCKAFRAAARYEWLPVDYCVPVPEARDRRPGQPSQATSHPAASHRPLPKLAMAACKAGTTPLGLLKHSLVAWDMRPLLL
ncbi:hypothetical protein PSPO01_08709 [Paraphaeosphaeria sporulosa]